MTESAPAQQTKLNPVQRGALRRLERMHWKADDSEKLKFIKAIAQLAKDEGVESHAFSGDDVLHLPISFVIAQHIRDGRPLDLATVYRDALSLCL